MDLANLSVKLRPRSPWEGIDLGFKLARQWFLPLWLIWLASAIPFMLILTIAPLPLWLAGLLLWWFKPMYEPPLLFWLSRRLFNQELHWRELRRNWRSVVLPQLIANLTWRRLSPARSFVMPVAVLERLKGKARSRRINVLGRNGHAASWLTIIGVHFEIILELSLISLLVLLIPDELLWTDWHSYLLEPDTVSEWIHQFCSLLAMSLMAPFYVSAGFVLYLTRRSELEAWDLELGLKRMAQRYRESRTGKAVALLLVGCLAFSTMHFSPVEAAEVSREQVQETIEEVLQHEDFGRYEERTKWKFIGEKSESGDNNWLIDWLDAIFKGFGQNFAFVSELLLWLLAGGVLAYLIYWFVQNQGLLRPSLGKTERGRRTAPTHIAGLDLRPESLPDNPAEQAARLIESGDYRQAFSLLYRGALSTLVHNFSMEIHEGATEGECRRLAQEQLENPLSEFFSRLTSIWLMLAYGHRNPEKSEALSMCEQWQSRFGGGG